MFDFADIKTLAICYGLCCCTQLVAFLLQYRINRGGQGLQWWTLGSAMMVFGFFVNSFRGVDTIYNVVTFVYSLSFMVSFLLVYIGLSEFVGNKKYMRPALLVTCAALVVLVYFVFFLDSLFFRRSVISFSCSIVSLLSALTVAGGNCKNALPARFLKYVFIFNAVWLFALVVLPLWSEPELNLFKRSTPIAATYFLLMTTSTFWTIGLIMLVSQKLSDQLRLSKQFLESTLNGLSANIALINAEGEIVLVNQAWREFAADNGIAQEFVSERTNYLSVCEGVCSENTNEAHTFAQGMEDVLQGRLDSFVMEYGCHSPEQKRWFLGKVNPFRGNGPRMVVVAHEDITERKLAEVALAESNHKLELMTNEDGLTKISNRRHFDTMLAYECRRHVRSGATLSLIMLDIDFFKHFNDTYGHVKGDECLQSVAQVVAECLKRPTDMAARYGGEEFVCLLPDTDVLGAVSLAEDIRRAVMQCAIPHAASQVASVVTVSIGVVSCICEEDTTPEQIVQWADEQLYLAKSEGRNCVKFCAGGDELQVQHVGENSWGLKVVWNRDYSSGNAEIDAQHMELVAIVNSLLEHVIAEDTVPDLNFRFQNVYHVVEKHFADEEAILVSSGYPDAHEHVAQHNELLQKCADLLQQDAASPVSSVQMLQCIIHDLVLNHMIKEDGKYVAFLKITNGNAA
jgi:diguanylate cyclase (GGDEF) domain/hemerythrin-like metal-binding domain